MELCYESSEDEFDREERLKQKFLGDVDENYDEPENDKCPSSGAADELSNVAASINNEVMDATIDCIRSDDDNDAEEILLLTQESSVDDANENDEAISCSVVDISQDEVYIELTQRPPHPSQRQAWLTRKGVSKAKSKSKPNQKQDRGKKKKRQLLDAAGGVKNDSAHASSKPRKGKPLSNHKSSLQIIHS